MGAAKAVKAKEKMVAKVVNCILVVWSGRLCRKFEDRVVLESRLVDLEGEMRCLTMKYFRRISGRKSGFIYMILSSQSTMTVQSLAQDIAGRIVVRAGQ